MNCKQTATYPLTLLVALMLLGSTAPAQHVQQFDFGGKNGSGPNGGLIVDASGNFYGVTYQGGSANLGVAYEISPTSNGATETVLYNFTGSSNNGDGAAPVGELVPDQVGNLYGVTQQGGNQGNQCAPVGCGTVFELSPPLPPSGAWTETILYAFQGGLSDGAKPSAGLTFDAAGNLYGTTQFGGIVNGECPCGTVFELSPPGSQGGAWTETILYIFQGEPDGNEPLGSVTFDQAGNLYSTTFLGGTNGTGTVFELAPPTEQGDPWTETVLHNFIDDDGSEPQAGVALAPNGALFGTTGQGGGKGSGNVFRLAPPSIPGGAWQITNLHSFDGSDGARPLAPVIIVNGSTLYGTTNVGGDEGGVVFRISASGGTANFTVLYSFYQDSSPEGRLMVYAGALYGATGGGGFKNNGTAYRLR